MWTGDGLGNTMSTSGGMPALKTDSRPPTHAPISELTGADVCTSYCAPRGHGSTTRFRRVLGFRSHRHSAVPTGIRPAFTVERHNGH